MSLGQGVIKGKICGISSRFRGFCDDHDEMLRAMQAMYDTAIFCCITKKDYKNALIVTRI